MTKPVRVSLNRTLGRAGMASGAVKAFIDWPTLERVANQYLRFVSPWVVVDGEYVAETTLKQAITAYDAALPEGFENAHKRFLERLARSAEVLATVRISVKDKDGCWSVWSYDEPLTEMMANSGRSAILIRRREQPVATGPVMIKLLAAITSTWGMEVAGLDFQELLG